MRWSHLGYDDLAQVASALSLAREKVERPSEEKGTMIVFQAHKKAVNALAFSPDSRRLATSGKDADIRVWQAPYESASFVCACPASWWSSLAFSADGRNLGCVRKGGVRVWEVADISAQVRMTSPEGWQCCFSPRGEVFYVAEHSKPLRRWRTAEWAELAPSAAAETRTPTDTTGPPWGRSSVIPMAL